ncbi:hypothetical protein ME1_00439 [Bartonella vinsonii subsp. arupensis OK-94-513]|uniref:TrbC/VIRB2 family n=2 Tax=Bartonella vinsonii subsp. arupensis TaxID=110578 RepID=J0R286_BARVI|nr:VirB2 family type IV secretion system major pilin TrwL [Bartonella vinsonii]EJF89669.1 hypothetical protein ME1_00439 [Bartonella vinsonii subsp. arupensis OK-94-513]EJF98320.1 hypothetical protein MEI_00819 [Bartonella vinsonii subsp. arupensis Pm136co]
MKQFNTLKATMSNRINVIIATTSVFFMTHNAYAQAKGLENAKKALDEFKKQLDIIIPLAAAVILLCLAIGYAGRYIEKDTFVRWAIGVVIAGSAVELANLLFKTNG